MFEFVKISCVVLYLIVCVNGKACGKCDCAVSSSKPGVTTDLLTVNCTNSGISSTVNLPDISLYTFTVIVLESSGNKHDFVKEFSTNPITKLNLAKNEIKRIDDEAFRSLTKLTELNLSGNKLKNANLSMETFKGLKNLRILNLYDTGLVRLRKTTFSEMTSLVELNIGRNYFDGELDPKLFDNIFNLEVLNIAENNLGSLNPDTFLTLKKLQVLNASWNSLEEFEEKIFVNSDKIQILDLSHNHLTTIGPDTFKDLNDLTILDLSYNRLTEFEDDMIFARKLRVINFGNNQLKDVTFLADQQFENLSAVYLESNLLTNVDFMRAYSTIQILNVSSNQLSTLPLTSQPLLFTLDISNNSFPTIPDIVNSQNLPALSNLILDLNPIKNLYFPSNSKPFSQLAYLSICNMPNLTVIKAVTFENLVRTSSGNVKRETQTDREIFDKLVNDSDSQMVVDTHDGLFDDVANGKSDDLGDPKIMEQEVMEDDDEKESVEDLMDVDGDIDEVEKKGEDVKEVDDKEDGTSVEESKEVETPVLEDADTPKSLYGEGEKGSDEVIVKGLPKILEVADEKAVDVKEDIVRVGKDSVEGDVAVVEEQVVKTSGELRAVTKRVAAKETAKVVQECGKNSLYLKISRNKNLDTIEAGAMVGLNICKLDLSYNSLRAVPDTIVDWNAVPSIDLQFNPWDCTCAQQWMLEVIVPKLYKNTPELLYELRCGSPALLLNRRFVHYHEWTEKAFCVVQRERIMKEEGQDQGEVGVVLKLGDSSGTIIIIGVCCGVVLLLVGVGIFLQWRITLRRRNRNRRL